MLTALVLVGLALPLASCGDDDDAPPADTPVPTGSATAAATSPPAEDLKAIDLVPDLSGIGMEQSAPETLPNTGALDIALRFYQRTTDPQIQARAEVRVYPDEDIADDDFSAQAQGWKNPPPGLFGGEPDNLDAPALEDVDDAAAYIAANTDPQGFRLWTDVFRVGRVIVVAHVLGQNEADVTPVRHALADSIRDAVR